MASSASNLQILYEDNHLLIVNKNIGDLIQGDKTGDATLGDLVKAYIKEKYQKPGAVFLGVVHRLDRPTSGVVIFARTSKALERLNKMLREKQVKKTYWALVKRTPKKNRDTLVHYLKKNPKNNKSTAFHKETVDSKKATLHYNVVKKFEHYALLEIDLETGRHHQIRAQLSAIGSPIKGDLKYGFNRSNPNGGIHLHARRIEFIHPVSKEPIVVEANVPYNDVLWDQCH